MGQKIGRLPDTWRELIEEKNRVLHWSSEVLARVDDNITTENTFLMDYDNEKIDKKIDRWIENEKEKWETAISKYPQEYRKNVLKTEVMNVADDIRYKMRKDYQRAYARMKKFTKRVDALGVEEQKIHKEIQNLEVTCENDVKLFVKKFGPLRKKVFENLRTGEKMGFEDKKLKVAFTKKINQIDDKYMEECAKRIDTLVKDFEKCAEINST